MSSESGAASFSSFVFSPGHSHLQSTTHAWHSPTSSTSSTSSYPPPEPPVILPPDASNSGRPSSPHHSFLSAGPAIESTIEVETLQCEYKLHVPLPGFKRDGITLASKRRRVLHVVADRWDNGGGHFERRVAFGYDADLGQVKAEFDGEILHVIVPRRISPANWCPQTRPAPIGRSS